MNRTEEKWHSIDVSTRPDAVEAIEFALNSLDALGTATSFRRVGQTEEVTVSGYFTKLPDEEQVQDELHYALRAYGFDDEAVTSLIRGRVDNQDWLAEWKKHWQPTEIGRFVIAPPWAELPQDDKIVIRIEPNMAFGTGTHETTQLCVSAIDRFYQPGESFLDVGTGTGILAIAAAKIGGNAHVYGCDMDEDSIAIAKENAELNGVGNIGFDVGTISTATPRFDFVCANLTVDVIVPILDLLLERSAKSLVLSGILAEQETLIDDALRERSITEFTVERSGEWIAVIIDRSPG
jgi:ribosomal protein L11 methyltransferase